MSEASEPTASTESADPPDTETVPLGGARRTKREAHAPGTRVGRYVLVEEVGRGGMGVVYRAYDPELNRGVALKLLSVRGRGKEHEARARRRLQREAQALAQLNHPNVVAVYDVGDVESGVYVAMELVSGVTMKEWLRRHERPWREVVRHFCAAGRGLAAAHAAGLVHRDFKPSNIVIGDEGRARVIDFGLARAVQEPWSASDGSGDHPDAASPAPGATRPDEPEDAASPPGAGARPHGGQTPPGDLATPLTMAGAILGTPAYMAPEQHQGHRSDELSDQFAFCVSMYEALYGHEPFEADTIDDVLTRKANGAVREPPADTPVPHQIRDAVLRGLAPDPEARHPSLEQLLDELETAIAPRMSRRRWLVGGIAAVLIAGAATIGVATLTGAGPTCDTADEEIADLWTPERRAEVTDALTNTGRTGAAETADRLARVVEDYTDRWATMHTEACEATRIRGTQSDLMLDRRMRCLERSRARIDALLTALSDDPSPETVSKALSAATKLSTLAPCADTEALLAAAPLPTDPETRREVKRAQERLDRAYALDEAGLYDAGLDIAERVNQEAEALGHPPLLAAALHRRGRLEANLGRYDEADASLERAIEVASRVRDFDTLARAWTQRIWTTGYQQKHLDEAMTLSDAARSAVLLADDDAMRALFHNTLGAVLLERADHPAAREHFETFVRLTRKVHGEHHPHVPTGLNNIGLTYLREGAFDEARTYLEQGIEGFRSLFGESHPQVATAHLNLGKAAAETGDRTAAAGHFQKAAELGADLLGEDHPFVASAEANLGMLQIERGEYEAARRALEKAFRTMKARLGPEHMHVGMVGRALGRAHRALGRHDRALELHRRALDILGAALPAHHPEVALAHVSLGRTLQALDRNGAAIEQFDEAREIHAAADPPRAAGRARALVAIGETHLDAGHAGRAVTVLERAVEVVADAPEARATARFALAKALWETGATARARQIARAARDDVEDDDEAIERIDSWLAGHGDEPPQ